MPRQEPVKLTKRAVDALSVESGDTWFGTVTCMGSAYASTPRGARPRKPLSMGYVLRFAATSTQARACPRIRAKNFSASGRSRTNHVNRLRQPRRRRVRAIIETTNDFFGWNQSPAL